MHTQNEMKKPTETRTESAITLFTTMISPNKWTFAEETFVNELKHVFFSPFGIRNLCFAYSFCLCPSKVCAFLWGRSRLMLFHCPKANKQRYARCSPAESLGFLFFKIWKITQHQKDNGKAPTIWPSASAFLWGSPTACIMGLLWKFTEAKKQSY